jgi:hypothetical protein
MMRLPESDRTTSMAASNLRPRLLNALREAEAQAGDFRAGRAAQCSLASAHQFAQFKKLAVNQTIGAV